MTTIVNDLIERIQKDALMLTDMAAIYPGDSTGDITVQAQMLNKAAEWLLRINWDTEQQLMYDSLPKVEVTYN